MQHAVLKFDLPDLPAREWRGPTLDTSTGLSVIGVRENGAPALYGWWAPTGAVPDLIIGGPGSGKTGLSRLLLTEEQRSELLSSAVIDPFGVRGVPPLVDWYAGATDGVDLLHAVEQIARDRDHHLARAGFRTWSPQSGLPLIVLTIEEAPAVLEDPVAARAVERITRLARKCGIKIRVITQDMGISSLGGSPALRNALSAGNVIVFRTNDWLCRSAAKGWGVDLDRIHPNRPGMGYLIDHHDPASNHLLTRVDHVSDTTPERRTGHDPRPLDAAAFTRAAGRCDVNDS